MAAHTYFANFIGQREDADAEYEDHVAMDIADQMRSGLLVGDVEAFANCTDSIQEALDGRDLTLLAGGPP